jgi:hypothetical protein
MNVEIGAEAAIFPEKEHISGIFVAVRLPDFYKNQSFYNNTGRHLGGGGGC